jgi:VWFA-related protein
MFWWKVSRVSIVALLPLTAQPAQEPSVFHSETRLVEVEVVVRDKPVRPPGAGAFFRDLLDTGPPFGAPGEPVKGLTKDDFTLLDQGKPQQIAVFRVGLSGDKKLVALLPGAVSNRTDSHGQPLNGATVILIDFLNTSFEMRGYERLGMTDLLRSFAETENRIAHYTLGEDLHLLHDFTDDPKKLTDLASADRDYGDVLEFAGPATAASVHSRMTANALRRVIQHLAGMPGRKNLVWMMDNPLLVPPAVMALARQANIVLYPVMVRTVPFVWKQQAARNLAALTGARAFFDAKDLTFAARATEEDTSTAYVLGYYPDEDMLDGKYHQITVKLQNKELEVHYRPGYLATKVAIPAPGPAPEELLAGVVDSARIGLAAQVTPEEQHPGLYDLHVTVDLHDIHLESKDGHFTGAFDLSVPNPSVKGTVKTGTIAVDLTDEKFAEALEHGYTVSVFGAESESGEILLVIRDHAAGTAGSLRVPIAQH